ncbi:RNA pseudouridylate synthase domain-containing protein 1 [Rhincodon typus]|uniref:RNA pseudouridylate synthase domain-containing protein 1 n=1 Tax=Rhincodon typus TaxID=259920 RepID=UPI0009A43078|nr:RNA pseudouridylate synthase domain-containing protein 1 [Rhincodon typus]XP_048465776.1 RNA pseudouridylate synthase domain-containing protein 1 [Rhincodon typus]XP_048465778.1 RNA pseudouridylate synthase domain-containing protein 1 [Rhincodon typus]
METARIDNLCILYQSSDFLVVNKHWDIRIDSKMWYEKLTVQSQLKHRFPELVDPDTYYGFRFCHQLDFSTSGALCIAFSKLAAAKAYRCFRDRLVTKVYLALVRGHVAVNRMLIEHAIGKNTNEGKTHMMCTEETQGCQNPKPSQTEMIVLAKGFYSGDPVTKVLLQPLTGRTHQLRVHCMAVGHPIVGDFTYSLKTDSNPYRMMLHAYHLRIPMEGELIEVTTADPFTHMVDSNLELGSWVNNLHDIIERLKGKSVTEQCDRDSMLEIQAEKTQVKKTSEETEEERDKYLQWLNEWTMS